MAVYAVDKLIAEARKIAADYRRATGKPLPGVSAEICIHDAARLLDLDTVTDGSPGHDAIGRGKRAGRKIQVKGRVIFDEGKSGHRLGQLRTEQDWDSVMLVLMDEDLEPYEIYEAGREALVAELEKTSGSRRNRRGAMSVARFRMIAQLVWTRENGEEQDEIWDNRS